MLSWDKFSAYQRDKANERETAAEYYTATAQQGPDSCRSIVVETGIFDWLTCLANNISTDGSVKQAEYDLKAQQDMAVWALGMLIVTLWLSAITLIGVLFVGWTLRETRKAVRAADDAVDVTRDIGEAQVRAYVRITGGSVKLVRADPGMADQRVRPKITIKVRNYGQSPAISFQWSVTARYYPPMHGKFLGSNRFPGESWGKDIGCDEGPSFTKNLGSAPLDESAMQALTSAEFHMDFLIRYVFRDVFKNRIEDERVFTAFVPVDGIDVETPLLPHVFDKETIDRLIEANDPENIARMREAMRRSE